MPSNTEVSIPNGIIEAGLQDQYANGKAAKVWEIFIGDKDKRTNIYRNFLVNLLKENGCKRILDVACGTGVDSVMLLEEGFEVVSIDASDKMLKYALKKRWDRRKEPNFDKWVIEEANWLTLTDDIKHIIDDAEFDAVICLGNSFAHMPDPFGDQRQQKKAIDNFRRCLKPGGLLLIDHRNYDFIIKTGEAPTKCIYYNSSQKTDIEASVLYHKGKPTEVTLNYAIDMGNGDTTDFVLSYYPHKLEDFSETLKQTFEGSHSYKIYGDFQTLDEIKDPAFYIHVIEK